MAGPARRLGTLTGAAVLALTVAATFGDGGLGSPASPAPVRPAGVISGEAGCPGGVREVVLGGLGRPIKIRLDGNDRVRHRSVIRRRPSTGKFVRDHWQLVQRDPCLRPPCTVLEGGSKSYDPRICADR